MANDPLSIPPELIAIAVVVENSTTVFAEWPQILNYVTMLLKRLLAASNIASIPFRIGVISYGPSESLSSPISCRRFFADHNQILFALKSEPSILGLASTSPPATKGLASLEALVGALELFEDFDQSLKDPFASDESSAQIARRVTKHIIHIGAAFPDLAPAPLHNYDPKFDDITWDTLPLELKKRDIHYDGIFVRAQSPDSQYVKLHHALGQKTEPWFLAKAEHTILLSKYPDSPQGLSASVQTAQQLQLQKQKLQQQRLQQQAAAASQALAQQQKSTQALAQQTAQQPQEQAQVQTPSKRSNDSTDNGADPKRPRLSESAQNLQAPSSGSPANVASTGTMVGTNEQLQRAAPAPSGSAPPPGQGTSQSSLPRLGQGIQNQEQLLQVLHQSQKSQVALLKQMETEKQKKTTLEQEIPQLRAAGRIAEAVEKEKEYRETSARYARLHGMWAAFKAELALHNAKQSELGGQGQVQGQAQMQGHRLPMGPTNNGTTTSTNQGADQPVNRLASPFEPVPPAAPGVQRIPSSQSPGRSGVSNPGPTGLSPFQGQGPPGQTQDPHIQNQLAKMLDQKNRVMQPQTQGQLGVAQTSQQRFPMPNNMNLNSVSGPATMVQGQPINQRLQQAQAQAAAIQAQKQARGAQQAHATLRQAALTSEPNPLPQTILQLPAHTPSFVPVWVGNMKWSGSGQDGQKKELTCRIQVLSKAPASCIAHTWPDTFNLMPTRSMAVPWPDMQRWFSTHNPVVCHILPLGEHNRPLLEALGNTLKLQGVYASAAWTTPAGTQTSNALFFVAPGGSLGAAFFPRAGIPEMPKPMGASAAPLVEARKFMLAGGMGGGPVPMTASSSYGGDTGAGGMGGGIVTGAVAGGPGPGAMGTPGRSPVPAEILAGLPPRLIAHLKSPEFANALPEVKARFLDQLRSRHMQQTAQKAAAQAWGPSGVSGGGGMMGGPGAGSGMPNMGTNPGGMPNPGIHNPAAVSNMGLQSMANMAAMGMAGMVGNMNNANANGVNSGNSGSQGFNFMNAGMNMNFGQ